VLNTSIPKFSRIASAVLDAGASEFDSRDSQGCPGTSSWCCLFVDARASRSSPPDASRADPAAGLPARQGDRGAVPPWTEWWEEDVSPLFPDAATRAAVTAEEPRLPFAYYEQSVPVPTGRRRAWGQLLSVRHTKKWRPTLAAEVASSRSWPDSTFQLVDPEATADRLVTMADSLALHDT